MATQVKLYQATAAKMGAEENMNRTAPMPRNKSVTRKKKIGHDKESKIAFLPSQCLGLTDD